LIAKPFAANIVLPASLRNIVLRKMRLATQVLLSIIRTFGASESSVSDALYSFVFFGSRSDLRVIYASIGSRADAVCLSESFPYKMHPRANVFAPLSDWIKIES